MSPSIIPAAGFLPMGILMSGGIVGSLSGLAFYAIG